MEWRNSSMGFPHFFKVFLPTMSSELSIPVMFLDHIIHEDSRSFFLTGPSGNVWTVVLVKNTDDHYFFGKGWPAFARDHLLKLGDVCVFTYEGNSNFTVLILDKSGCVKESAYHAICSQDCTHSIRHKGKGVERNEAVKVPNAASYEFGQDSSKREGKKAANVSHIVADLKSGTIVSQRRKVTVKEKMRALKAAEAFRSKNPFQLMVMRHSYIFSGCNLPMPRSFKIHHLPDVEQAMILRNPSGEKWHVKYVVTKGDPMRGWLSGGWNDFAFRNNIEADDVCVFELVKENEMQVHIYRVVEDITPLIKHSIRKRRGHD